MDPQYLRDIADSAIFGTPVAFLQKYPLISHYDQILSDQDKFIHLIYKIIMKEAEGEQGLDIGQILSQSGFEEDNHKVLGGIIKNMYSIYKKQLIKRQICQGSKHLSCFNWKLKTILGCSEFTHKQKMLLQIEMTLSQKVQHQPAQVITLQLGIHEARQLLMKFKKIRKDLRQGIF